MNVLRFGEMVELVRDSVEPSLADVDRYVGLEHIDAESLKIRRFGVPSDVTSSKIKFRAGDVIFAKRRAYQRKVGLADFDGICSAHAMVLRPVAECMHPRFLPFFVQSDLFMDRAIGISVGGLSPTINWTDLSNEEFSLPSVDEQEDVLPTLMAVEALVEKMFDLGLALGELGKSLSNSLLNVETKNAVMADCATLDISRITLRSSDSYELAGVLNEGKGVFAKETLLGSETKYATMHRLFAGQIVMRKLTAWEGAIAVVDPQHEGSVVSSEFPTFRIETQKARPEYLRWVFRQPYFWREMESRCKGTARRRSRLHPSDLLKIPLHLPSLREQDEIAAILDHIEDARSAALARQSAAIRGKHELLDRFLRLDSHEPITV